MIQRGKKKRKGGSGRSGALSDEKKKEKVPRTVNADGRWMLYAKWREGCLLVNKMRL